jgi:hypothetical protein
MPEFWDPWSISERGFPRKGTTAEKLRFCLNYAVLAPSTNNTQPWLFKIMPDGVELYADRTRALPVVDPEDRELTISCGATLLHLRLALHHFGYRDSVKILPDRDDADNLARIKISRAAKPEISERALFEAIVKRRTNRTPFQGRAIPRKLLSSLQDIARREGTSLCIIEGEEDRNRLADLIAQADRRQMADPSFRRELAAWTHSNRSASHDGIPAFAVGYKGIVSSMAPLVVRTFDIGKGRAARDRQLATGSPVLAVLATDGDTVREWIAVGQSLARILLHARSEGVWASFLNQPVETPELRTRLRDLINRKGSPQIILRMGYGSEVKPTPRRTAGEVLMRSRPR